MKHFSLLWVIALFSAAALAYATAQGVHHELEMQDADTADVWCRAGILEFERMDEQWQQGHCEAHTRTPTPTASSTPTITSTATMTVTRTVTQTRTIGPTPSPVFDGLVPACGHEPTKWHGLVERNADGSIACTYGHEHKDDPRVLDRMFGPLTQEIDYPWHAFGRTGGPESHSTFKWSVIDQENCIAEFSKYSFNKIRMQTHAGYNGATLRTHSWFAQAVACDPNDPAHTGKVTIGGHMDYGRLWVGKPATLVPLPDQDALYPLRFDGDNGGTGPRRLHNRAGQFPSNINWAGQNGVGGNANNSFFCSLWVATEDWGTINPQEPFVKTFYGGNWNGSSHVPVYSFGITIPRALDTDNDGYVTYSGWLNRWGTITTGCTTPSTDCVPVSIENMKVDGRYEFSALGNGIRTRDYDVQVAGQSLITYPN